MEDIGFVGTGIMGKSMLRNLKKAGYTMHCYARHPEKVADLAREGVKVHATLADCVEACQVMISIVGYPKDVEEVYFGEDAIFAHARKGAYVIDMTTTSPTLAKRLYAEGVKRGLHVMDAPVTGGDTGARNGTLSILVGGDKEDYERMLPVFRGMGTTFVACSVMDSTLFIMNVGDSRLYVVGENIRQITRDHSLVEELVDEGRIDRDSPEYLHQKNIITRAVGITPQVQADFFEIELEEGEAVLMCSDGLSNMVGDERIAQIVHGEPDPDLCVRQLVREANENGGRDNISVVLIRPEEG